MHSWLCELIKDYTRDYSVLQGTQTRWQEPLVGFVGASDERFLTLKETISATHASPFDFLPDARTVITYFIPFDNPVEFSNRLGDTCSREWALAYIETNQLIFDLNTYVSEQLTQKCHTSAIIPATHNFDKNTLLSDWSHRHIAVLAGLGTFGLNNMLITDKGCCGRVGSIVTNISIAPTHGSGKENCLYKYSGVCKKCISRCPVGALTLDGFDRHKCYSEKCLENANVYSNLGLVDACGKCLVDVPCSHHNPTLKIE